MKIRFIHIIYVIVIVVVDLLVYLALGVLLMGYDDNWHSAKGEYGSWGSMSLNEKLVQAGFITWNCINVIVIIFLIYRLYRKLIKQRQRAKSI